MASLVSGLFDLFNGDPTKKEQNQLGALGGYQTGVGEGLTTAGATFDEAILSGDQGRISQALAPEISAGQQQVQQQKNQDAQFAPRSGGTAASTANAETAERGNIINLAGGLQSGTAGQALSSGGNLLGQASSDIQSQAQLAEQARQQQLQDITGVASGIAQIATPFMPKGNPGENATGSGGAGDTGSIVGSDLGAIGDAGAAGAGAGSGLSDAFSYLSADA